jgi:hypothetical protein
MDSNTIYEYYEQVSDRHFIARTYLDKGQKKLKYMWQPFAKKVTVRGFEDFDLFIYQEKMGRKYFMLVEGLTGAVILRQCDLASGIMRRCGLKLFTDYLPAELNRMGGRANLNQLIINWMVDTNQEISPQYKAIKV